MRPPHVATGIIKRETPWLLLDFSWLVNVSNRIKKGLGSYASRMSQSELPHYLELRGLSPEIIPDLYLIYPYMFSREGYFWTTGGLGGGGGGGGGGAG